MRRVLISLAALGLLACNPSVRQAKTRVETVMEGLQMDGGGSSGYIQTAIKQWRRGPDVDMDELASADLQFQTWARQKNVYRKIGSYKVLDAKADGEHAAVVTVDIEGKTYRIRVPYRDQMSWAD